MTEDRGCALVLAGGGSRRMGQDKALLRHEGRTFLEHVIAALQTLTPNIFVVTDRADKYASCDARVVIDRFPDVGPVGGIASGLVAAGPGTHYVVPCDMPTVSASVLRLVREQIGPDDDAAIPIINDEPEPLYAVYRDTAAPKLLTYLESGRRSARGALSALRVRRVDESVIRRVDATLTSFANINTPEELTAFAKFTKLVDKP